MSVNATTKPVFCPDCRNPNTFDRAPAKDVMYGDHVGWEAWTCRKCGYKAIEPTGALRGEND
jgi:C4-type Zn-finger protein